MWGLEFWGLVLGGGRLDHGNGAWRQGLGFKGHEVWGLRLRVQGAWGSGFKIWGSRGMGFGVKDLGFQGYGFWG